MTYADTLLANGERVTLRSHQHWLAIVIDARAGFLALLGAIVLLFLGGVLDPSGAIGTIRQALGWVTLALLVGGLGQILLVIANWRNEEYIVTNRRVMKVNGLINKHSADSSLEKINDAVLDQNVFGRILNYGDLDIITAAEETVDRYRMLRAVITFKKEILNQKHDLEFEQMRPPAGPPLRAPAPPPAAPPMAPPLPLMPPADMTIHGDVNPDRVGVGSATSTEPAAPPAEPAAMRATSAADVTQTLSSLGDLRDRGVITPEEFEAKKADLLSRL